MRRDFISTFCYLVTVASLSAWLSLHPLPTSYLMVLAWDFIFCIPAIIMAIGSRIISPIVTATMHKLVVTMSFGLNQGELSFAYVYVDERLDLQVHAPNIEHWNVQVRCIVQLACSCRLLASQPARMLACPLVQLVLLCVSSHLPASLPACLPSFLDSHLSECMRCAACCAECSVPSYLPSCHPNLQSRSGLNLEMCANQELQAD